MQDMKAHLEKLPADAAECESISDRATGTVKRELNQGQEPKASGL